MRLHLAALVAVTVLAINASSTMACHDRPTCNWSGVLYACDRCPFGGANCPSAGGDDCGFYRCQNDTSIFCDDNTDCASVGGHCMVELADGRLTICGTSGNDTLNGTTGADLICGFDGNDTIDAKGGDDVVIGGGGTDTLIGGTGNDIIHAGDSIYNLAGDDFIDGGSGNDTIYGSSRFFGVEGRNVILAGNGDDVVYSGNGRDSVKGGDGDDFIATASFLQPLFPDDVYGTLLCGGDGDDDLYGYGPSHQCMDGGNNTGAGDACFYNFYSSSTATADDLGTFRNCENQSNTGPSCGCET
jgi:Ca2+-binding RTX toxin-like protein